MILLTLPTGSSVIIRAVERLPTRYTCYYVCAFCANLVYGVCIEDVRHLLLPTRLLPLTIWRWHYYWWLFIVLVLWLLFIYYYCIISVCIVIYCWYLVFVCCDCDCCVRIALLMMPLLLMIFVRIDDDDGIAYYWWPFYCYCWWLLWPLFWYCSLVVILYYSMYYWLLTIIANHYIYHTLYCSLLPIITIDCRDYCRTVLLLPVGIDVLLNSDIILTFHCWYVRLPCPITHYVVVACYYIWFSHPIIITHYYCSQPSYSIVALFLFYVHWYTGWRCYTTTDFGGACVPFVPLLVPACMTGDVCYW